MLSTSSVTNSSFHLMWQNPPSEDQNGIIRQYLITIVEEDTGRQFQLTSLVNHILVNFLHPFYTYVSTVAASTVRIGPNSTPVSVTTLEAGIISCKN